MFTAIILVCAINGGPETCTEGKATAPTVAECEAMINLERLRVFVEGYEIREHRCEAAE